MFQNTPQTLDLMIKNTYKFETENLEDIRANRKLVDLIKNLNGYHIFLWTSNSQKTAQKVLKKLGILKKFEKLICREDVKFLKPEIDAFNLIYDGKSPKSKYLFIGNDKYDRQAAKSACVDFYLIDYFH